MTHYKVAALVLFLLATTTSLFADVVVKYTVHANLITPPERLARSRSITCEAKVTPPETGGLVTITWCADKARLDRADLSAILRLDEGRLYIVFHPVKKFAVLKYPISDKKYRLPFEEAMGSELLRYQVKSIVGPEQTKFLDREAARYSAVVANGLRNQWRAMFILATQLPSDPGPALALRAVLHDLRFGGNGWIGLLPTESRLPLVWEEAERQPQTESLYREEATEIVERTVSPETYAPPREYATIKYDPLCMR